MLRSLLAVLTGAIALIVGFMFSLVMLAVIAIVGLTVWGYLMWKTRKVRTAMREQAPIGNVIEGEAVVVDDGTSNNILPEQRLEE